MRWDGVGSIEWKQESGRGGGAEGSGGSLSETWLLFLLLLCFYLSFLVYFPWLWELSDIGDWGVLCALQRLSD